MDAVPTRPLSSRQTWAERISPAWAARIRWCQELPDNTLSSSMLCVVVAGAPFLFGSREASTVALWVLWLGLAAMIMSPRDIRRPHSVLMLGVMIIAAAYAVVLHEQLSTHPWLALPHPIWAQASQALGLQLVPSASAVRYAPYYGIGPLIANGLALLLGMTIGTDRVLARRVLGIAGCAGVLYAIYGLFADLFTPTSVLWREKEAYVGALTSTFINRNTAATYFGCVSVIWLVFLLEAVRDRLPRGRLRWDSAWNKIVLQAHADTIVPFLLFFLCLSALFMTQSRGGVIVSAGAFILTVWLFFHRDLMIRANRLMAVLVAALISISFLQVLTGAVGHRLDTQGLVDAGRLATYKATIRMIADHPWFGSGLGTFAFAFPAYRGTEVSMYGVWDMAHSTPLQMAAEVGIPLTVLVSLAWLAALVVLLRAVFIRRRDTMFPLTAFAVAIIALCHSSIDFSLQVAGLSIVVFAVVGIGLAQSFRSPPQRRLEETGRVVSGSERP